jgi:hypothetical protein
VKEITQKMSVQPSPFWAGGRVEGLKHSDVGSSVSHLVVGAEVVMPPVHAKLVGEVSCLPIQGKEPGRFGGRYRSNCRMMSMLSDCKYMYPNTVLNYTSLATSLTTTWCGLGVGAAADTFATGGASV